MERLPVTISVILATYNRASYIAACLDSILGQTRSEEEIIVINDGSTDDTADVLSAYAGYLRYFVQQNKGKAAALNFAIPRARGTHLCIFDDDDVLLPDALAQHTAYLASHPDIDYTYSSKFFFDDHGADGPSIWDEQYWRHGPVNACPPEALFIRTMEWNGALMQGMAVSARCFDKVGQFSEQLFRSQDYDMMLRLARACRGADIGRPTFVHRNHAGSRGAGAQRHDEEKRYAVWHAYDRKIFRKLRHSLALAEYLPLNHDLAPRKNLSPSQHFDALRQRANIMFKRGLFAEGAEDLCLMLAHEALDEPRFRDIEELVRRVANIGVPDYVPGAIELAKGLGAAPAGARSKRLVENAEKGLYWGFREALKRKRWRHAVVFLRALAILVARR